MTNIIYVNPDTKEVLDEQKDNAIPFVSVSDYTNILDKYNLLLDYTFDFAHSSNKVVEKMCSLQKMVKVLYFLVVVATFPLFFCGTKLIIHGVIVLVFMLLLSLAIVLMYSYNIHFYEKCKDKAHEGYCKSIDEFIISKKNEGKG